MHGVYWVSHRSNLVFKELSHLCLQVLKTSCISFIIILQGLQNATLSLLKCQRFEYHTKC